MFTPHSLMVQQIFGDSNALYQIPRYQRPYRWVDDQVEKLWDDLYEAFQEGTENYFLGSIILAADNIKAAYYDVVDGQQRLTTLTILLCVIRDLFPNLNQSNSDLNPKTITHSTILNSILFNGLHNRLITHPQHQMDFDTLIVKGDTLNLFKPSKENVYADEEPKYKFANTACIFIEKFRQLGVSTVGEFVNYIFNNVFIIRIDCETTEFAIRMFQVLNDRGLDLSNADLIKSYLYERIKDNLPADSDAYRKKNEEVFIAGWQEIEHYTKGIDVSLNDLLMIYNYSLNAANPRKSLYEELQKTFKNKNSLDVVNDIKKFVKTYSEVLYDTDDSLIYSFWYLRWSMYWKSILLTALTNYYPSYRQLAILLRRYYYLNWIAGRTLTKVKQTSFSIINWIKEGVDINVIESRLEKRIIEDDINSDVVKALSAKNVYYTSWIKPLLLLIEYEQTDSINKHFLSMNRDLHIEHILPVNWQQIPQWAKIFDIDSAENYLNSIGNLTLLLGKKNIEASDNAFDVKIKVYQGKGKYDDSDKKITSFAITQKVLTDYTSSTYNKEWNEQAIIDRWNWFLSEVEKLFAIDLALIRK